MNDLIAALAKKSAELAEKDRELDRLNTKVEELSTLVDWLKQQLGVTLQRTYGRSRERLEPGQLSLFEDGVVGPPPEPQPEPRLSKPRKKKSEGHGRSPFPERLEREVIDCDVAEDERRCTECDSALKAIGHDACERGHYIPPKIIVRQYRRHKYGCPLGHQMKTGEAPAALVDRCKYEPSVFAHVAVAKYDQHLPLHRQQVLWKRLGFDLPRSTMWDMLRRIDEIAVQPILAQCRDELLRERVIQADETMVPVVVKGQKGSSRGYFWVWRAGDKQLIQFTNGRGRDGPKQMLGPWRGTLVTDGYDGYQPVAEENKILRAGCWSHARRRFKEDLEHGSGESKAMLRLIQRLFRLERACARRVEARELTDEDAQSLRRRVREKRSRPLSERIRAENQRVQQLRICTPKSELGQAVTYLKNQWLTLTVFLDDPDVPIHNNASEQALRHVVLGRKNWQVAGSPRGAEVAAHLYSLIGTCRALSVDPEAYLNHVLVAVETTPTSRVAELTPWAWAAAHPDAKLS